MQRTIWVLILAVIAASSCKRDNALPAAKATAQNTMTIKNTTGRPLSLNFRAHDINNSVAYLNSNSVVVNPQSTVTFNSPADLNTNPGWAYAQLYTAPGDWDGVKGGPYDIGQGWELGNYQPAYPVDSVWSLYYPQINATGHAAWKHVNGGYELDVY